MRKLLKLKEWLTVPDAAKYLSIVFEEEVVEADLLRFALEGRLRLSVYFVNGTQARPGKVIPIDEAEYKEVPSLCGTRTLRLYGGPTLYSAGRESSIVELEESVVHLSGLFDLPMFGQERLDIRNKYHQLIGAPKVTDRGMDGAFVEGRDGLVCQLQEDYENNEFVPGSRADLDWLKQHIAENVIAGEEAKALLDKHKKNRNKFLEERKSQPASKTHYPASGLPLEDSVLVIRTDVLREFESQVNEPTHRQPESTRKIENLLRALTSIAMDVYGYNPESGKNTAPKEIADAMSLRGFEKDEKTVRGWLKEGAALLPLLSKRE